MDFTELRALLDARLDLMLSADRAGHSRRVAGLAGRLCARNGLDPLRGEAAGLAHDLCKELPLGEQRALAAAYPGTRPSSELIRDKIIHGPAAAALLARDYGMADGEILEALALHTVGRPGMRLLSVLLYCADKLEPGRDGASGAERMRLLELEPLEMLRGTVAGTIAWLRARGRAVAPETILLRESLRESVPSI
jgi:predicted HD superfamily hydrolase involved in NAD metabolism